MQNPMSDKGSFTFALQEIFDANPNRKKRPFGNCAKLQEKKQNVYQFWDPSSQPLSFIQTIQGNRSWNQFEEKYSQIVAFTSFQPIQRVFIFAKKRVPKTHAPWSAETSFYARKKLN